jgi:hypothetical protein
MTRSTLGDLNLHLFAQLERLGDEDIKGDKLREEINRAEAITAVAQQIISNGALVLKVKQLSANKFDDDVQIPKMLEG